MKPKWTRSLVVVTGLSVLCACTTPPEPIEPPRAQAELPVPPLPRRPPVTEPRLVDAPLNVEVRDGVCLARASHPALSLEIEVRDGQVELTLRPSRVTRVSQASVQLGFSGEVGSWRSRGRLTTRGVIELREALDERAATRLLALISGGTLQPLRTGSALAGMRLAPAGERGPEWFECVRRQLVL